MICDVEDCHAPARRYRLGGLRRYDVYLCSAHAAGINAVPADEWEYWNSEGTTIYYRRGDDIYYSHGGSMLHHYRGIRQWPASPAAKRIAARGEQHERTAVAVSDRGGA